MSAERKLPQGIVTFLLSDVEGSTELWEQNPEIANRAMSRLDTIVGREVGLHRGLVIKPRGEGDSHFVVFSEAGDAVSAAIAIQRAIHDEPWPDRRSIRVRIGLHMGEADLRLGDYYGTAVNRCARLRGTAHGGQTVLSAAVVEAVREGLPDGASLADLGKHRLKGLSGTEQIYQLNAEGLPADFPPLRTLLALRTNLPPQSTPFVGRDAELGALRGLLTKEGIRLVTVTGPGGMGKTRLAIEAARQHLEASNRGAFFVPLAPLSSSDQIVQAVIEALSLSFSGSGDLKAHLLQTLRDKQLLLVMDNFEHLIDGATLVSEILRAGQRVSVMATSREKLNLSGETVFSLSGMHFGEWLSVEDALSDACAQLFLQGAQQALPEYELGGSDLASVAEIARMVGGMPLGILLAASWVDVLRPAEIADEIRRSLDFLESELRDLPARQRSIRAVFDTSWDRLSGEERALFKKLSVFRGGFTPQAARAVTGSSIRTLSGLVNKSFLHREAESGRFEVHELLRQLAEERLEVDRATTVATREAHSSHFAAFMERMTGELRSSRENEALDELSGDLDNVRSAWRFLLETGDALQVKRFIDGLWFSYEIWGWLHAGVALFGDGAERISDSAVGEESQVAAAQMMAAKGWFALQLGDLAGGLKIAQESLTKLKQLNRRQESLLALLANAVGGIFTNRPDDILRAAREILEIARDSSLPWWEALALNLVGGGNLAAGAWEEAERFATISIEKMAAIGENWGLVWPWQVMAGLANAQGDFSTARIRYHRVLESAKSLNFKRGLIYTYNNLGNVNLRLEEYGEAQRCFLQSLSNSEEAGQIREVLTNLVDLARLQIALQNERKAIELLAPVLQHPARNQHGLFRHSTIDEEGEQLRAQIEGKLTKDAYSAAWLRSELADLDAVVAELVKETRPEIGER